MPRSPAGAPDHLKTHIRTAGRAGEETGKIKGEEKEKKPVVKSQP
jgi:hypothetical protein